MSLVSSYVYADDGKWYQNPSIGVVGEWFLCFDDDDPDELVIFDRSGMGPQEVILKYNLPFKKPRRAGRATRCVVGGAGNLPAQYWWVEITGPIPHKLILVHDGEVTGRIEDQGQGVYHGYSFYKERMSNVK
jgi:hypothetical protein